MKKILLIIYILVSATLLFYVLLPNFNFPAQIPGSTQSKEPADMETPLRRAYFTDYTRSEVLAWYRSQFDTSSFMKIKLPTYLMNYPPEESGSIIRDQTRSTFLQEFVHPFRETLFINGYEPSPEDEKNRIVIDGIRYRQKIIVRFIPTNTILRFLILLPALISIPIIYLAFEKDLKHAKK
jgi:hypothetical protein